MTGDAGSGIGAVLALADAVALATIVVAPRADGTLPVTHRSGAAAELLPEVAPGSDLAEAIDAADQEPVAELIRGVNDGRLPSPATIAPLGVGGVRFEGATAVALPEPACVALALGSRGTLHSLADSHVFASLSEMSPDLVGVAGLDGRIRYLNPSGARLLGLATPDDAVGRSIEEFIPPDELDRLRHEELPTLLHGGVWTGERHVVNVSTGVAVPVDATSFLLRDRDGSPLALATIQRDVTRRRRIEQQLHDTERRLRLVVGQVPAFFWTTDHDLRVTELLGQAASSSGLAPVGRSLREHWGPDDPVGAIAAHERALAGESVRDEATIDGQTLRADLEPLRDESGEIIGVVGVAIDVTDERALEAQLRQSQKMEAVGQLAGGIAHDYNNMLLGIMGNVDLALLRLPEDAEDVRRPLANARHAAERSAELTRRLLTFGRKDATRPDAVDPNEVVRRAAELLTRTIGPSVRVDLRLSEGVRPIWIDPIRLEQVVMNLAINARDAMPEGGTLTISTGMRTDTDEPRVEVAVRDTGIGIPPEQQEHVFEPFFTTKSTGTGIGLATVYAVVTESGGDVTLTSAPGQGTTIRMRFPPYEPAGALTDGLRNFKK